jgi:hypothetical protein
MNYFVKKFLFVFFLTFALFGIFQFSNSNKVFAQGTPTPNLQCKVDKAVVNGAEISKDSIPSDTPFGLYIYCEDNSSPTAILGDYAAVINVGSTTLMAGQTVPAWYEFNFDLLFGNPFTASSGTPTLTGNNTYTVSILKSGIPVSCFSSSACEITSKLVLDTKPVPPPPAECAYFKAYDPAIPIKGQPFTIIIKNPSSGDYHANVGYFDIFWYKPSLNKSGTVMLFGDPTRNNIDWRAQIRDVNEEFMWNVQFKGQQCSDDHVLFGPGSTSTGKNPCLDTDGDGKVDTCPTAIGNIPTNLGSFATAVLRVALGITGGIVLILMVIGSIRVMTSSGDPQRVAAGRDMIVAAIAGALFIAFSVMIMQFLGTAVVPIPGLTFGT